MSLEIWLCKIFKVLYGSQRVFTNSFDPNILYNENDKEIYFKKLDPIKVNSREFYTDAEVSMLVESKVAASIVDFILEKGAEEYSSAFFIVVLSN